jgi:hypothetical protein
MLYQLCRIASNNRIIARWAEFRKCMNMHLWLTFNSICMAELRKTTKIFSWDSWSLGRSSNPEPPDYEAGVPPPPPKTMEIRFLQASKFLQIIWKWGGMQFPDGISVCSPARKKFRTSEWSYHTVHGEWNIRKASFDLNQKEMRILKAKEETGRRGDPAAASWGWSRRGCECDFDDTS